MLFRPIKSTIVIGVFIALSVMVWISAYQHSGTTDWGRESEAMLGKSPSTMSELEYFFLDNGVPVLSLMADSMESLGEDIVSFEVPRGTYATAPHEEVMSYQAERGEYIKEQDTMRLMGAVEMVRGRSKYNASEIFYRPKIDSLLAKGDVKVHHVLEQSGQVLDIGSPLMKARPKEEWAFFQGGVAGDAKPKFKFEETIYFKSKDMELIGKQGKVTLTADVWIKKGGVNVTSQNGEIFLERANKKLKYFIFNDDVKVTETLNDAQGRPTQRKAFAERLEGFGQDRMVLSGAPRVLQGKDELKGYRITMREKMELIEVEDAMSDLEVKKKEPKKEP